MAASPPSRNLGKISEAFLAFAQPVLRYMPESPSPSEVERACAIAEVVWNSVVLEKLGHRSDYLPAARRAIRDGMDGVAAVTMVGLLDLLERRKRDEAPEDLRLIGSLDAFVDEAGELRIRATSVELHGSRWR